MKSKAVNRTRFGAGIAAAVVAGMLFSGAAIARTELLVYTAVEADELAKFKNAFEADHPDIEIKWVRDSTGIVTAKLMAEKNNPQADIVWGLAASSLVLLAAEDYFEPYAPPGVKELRPEFVDQNNDPPIWIGQRSYVAAVCYNTVEGPKHGIPQPTSWHDLAKPEFKGHVSMPNPNSSGTGFLMVSSWIQMMGEEEAWKFMDALHENIAWYTHSGSKPCRQTAAGELPLGLSFAYRVVQSKNDGAPLELVSPVEGLGWELEAFAIVRGTDKLEAAKTLANWSVTRKANELYAPGYEVVALPGVPNPVPELEAVAQGMIANDFDWAAANRERILAEWQRRYDAKSEPRG
jgi:iron(III) transport system substrate-binding protein